MSTTLRDTATGPNTWDEILAAYAELDPAPLQPACVMDHTVWSAEFKAICVQLSQMSTEELDEVDRQCEEQRAAKEATA